MLGFAGLVTLLTGAIGVGTSLVGLAQKQSASKKQDKVNAQIAQQQQQIAAASARAEAAREEQMKLDAQRARRTTIREGQAARALASARQVGGGLSVGEGQTSTGFEGAKSQIASGVAYGLGGINASEQFGSAIFQSNRDIFGFESNIASLGFQSNVLGRQINEGQALFSLGRDITASAPAVSREATSLFERIG